MPATIIQSTNQIIIRPTGVTRIGTPIIVDSGPTLFVDEGFEGTGTPSLWFGSVAGIFDSTDNPLVGAQSLRLSGAGEYAVYLGSVSNLDIPEVFIKFRIKFSELPASVALLLQIWDSGSTARGGLSLLSTGQLRISDFGGININESTVNTITAGTAYDVEVHYLAGSGNTGVCSVGFVAAGGSIPTNGNGFAGDIDGNNSQNVGTIIFVGSNLVADIDWDSMQMATTFIP